MSASAITMMIIALGVIWGGFLFALLRLPEEK
ncbi:methionine/alanine import family NSS transporter small subunit [Rodentibacter trehalosifermentans]|nr:methionine/alanine import family NSS transporter small subunit [Rodentibacter trehalosifermentans]